MTASPYFSWYFDNLEYGKMNGVLSNSPELVWVMEKVLSKYDKFMRLPVQEIHGELLKATIYSVNIAELRIEDVLTSLADQNFRFYRVFCESPTRLIVIGHLPEKE